MAFIAIEWVKRCLNPMMVDSEIEIRQVFKVEDSAAAVTPELKEQAERLHTKPEELAKAAKK
jgi:hypothetical protein